MSRWIRYVLAAIVVVPVILLLYGTLIEPRFVLDVRRLDAEVPDLAEPWSGSTVAMFSDLQVGMWFDNAGMVERVVARTLRADPDLVLLGGDFLYSTEPDVETQVETVLELLAPLTDSGVPIVAVLGNHDHAAGGTEELTAALQGRGVEVLQNDVATVPLGEGDGADPLYVVGLGAARPGLDDADQALREIAEDAPRLVLMHNPTSFSELPADTAPLALAGHTHCGQIALPGSPHWSYLRLTEEEALVADGFAPAGYGADGNQLFVSCGIGFSLVPVRINAAPQLVLLELRPGAA